jgi:presequence protease
VLIVAMLRSTLTRRRLGVRVRAAAAPLLAARAGLRGTPIARSAATAAAAPAPPRFDPAA